MTDFRYWQNEANKQNLVMCVICFESKVVELMYVDKDGDTWDVCLDCRAHEVLMLTDPQ